MGEMPDEKARGSLSSLRGRGNQVHGGNSWWESQSANQKITREEIAMRFKVISSVAALGAIAVVLAWAMSVSAGALTTAPGQNKLLCFDGVTDDLGYGGTC